MSNTKLKEMVSLLTGNLTEPLSPMSKDVPKEFEFDRLEKDNWIPIEDRSLLEDGEEYLLQLNCGDIQRAVFKDFFGDAGFESCIEDDVENFELDEVEYYQRLP